MKDRTILASFSLAVLSLFALGARAQDAQHHPAVQDSSAGITAKGMKGQSATGKGMMGQQVMPKKMTASQQKQMPLMEQPFEEHGRPAKQARSGCAGQVDRQAVRLLEQMRGDKKQQAKKMPLRMKNGPKGSASQKPVSK